MQQAPKKFNKWLFSDLTEVITGFPQGSILCPFLFVIFFNGIFMFISNYSRYNYFRGDMLYASSFFLIGIHSRQG